MSASGTNPSSHLQKRNGNGDRGGLAASSDNPFFPLVAFDERSSFYLRSKSRFWTLLEGASSALDIWGTPEPDRELEETLRAIRSRSAASGLSQDWRSVGSDLQIALGKYLALLKDAEEQRADVPGQLGLFTDQTRSSNAP